MLSPFKTIAPDSACIISLCAYFAYKVAADKGISKIKSKQQSPCSNCMHRSVRCMHWPVMSQADACTYCIRSKVSRLSRIYLYSSYFVMLIVLTYNGKLFIRLVSDADDETMSTRVLFLLAHSCINI
jgi:hypothetical protein